MNDVNWWLMALSFLLGLLLTFAFMIRRVTREVPVYAALGRGPKADLKADLKAPSLEADVKAPSLEADVKAPVVDAPDVKSPDVDLPDVKASGGIDLPDAKTAGLAAGAAGAAGVAGAAAAKFAGGGDDLEIADESPFGAGSVRLRSGSAWGPSGYVVKGNEDSMLYHTTESPSYEQTIAEVWFREPADAERAGFSRWDINSRKGSGAATLADMAPGPYGVGSAKAGAGGTGPEGWAIKGNEDSMLYHTTESPSFKQTIAEVWFFDEESAVKAGFSPWHTGKK